MNLIDALKTKKPLRRPISKHTGSHGTGYLGSLYVLDLLIRGQMHRMNYLQIYYPVQLIIDQKDILADDWEIKLETEDWFEEDKT